MVAVIGDKLLHSHATYGSSLRNEMVAHGHTQRSSFPFAAPTLSLKTEAFRPTPPFSPFIISWSHFLPSFLSPLPFDRPSQDAAPGGERRRRKRKSHGEEKEEWVYSARGGRKRRREEVDAMRWCEDGWAGRGKRRRRGGGLKSRRRGRKSALQNTKR